jgi:mono/diheme cytochrome c family protein
VPRLPTFLIPITALVVAFGGRLPDHDAMFERSTSRNKAMASRHENAAADTVRSSMDGVYTTTQANRGADIFAEQCRSCHTPTVHSGPPFRKKWFGHTVAELFAYLRREMPKNEPGSLSDDDYAMALAYLLRINGMPAGSRPLAADSTALHRIRLDSVRTTPSPTSLPR